MEIVRGAALVLGCQRRGCDKVAVLNVGKLDPSDTISVSVVAIVVHQDWPKGWGWDALPGSRDRAMHCEAHRARWA